MWFPSAILPGAIILDSGNLEVIAVEIKVRTHIGNHIVPGG
jgi:hypothetical protein